MTDETQPTMQVSSQLAYVAPGMYAVRLLDEVAGSVITLYPAPVCAGSVEFFPGDGIQQMSLAKRGDCIVVCVKGEQSGLLLTEFYRPGQTARLTVGIDRIA